MSNITISLPDGSSREYPAGSTAFDVASSIGSRLAKAAVAATIDGTETDLTTPVPDGSSVAVVTDNSDEGRHVLRHSTAHVMAQAVTQLFPGAKYTIGPAIENGFYYDFDLPDGQTFTEADLDRIADRMRKIIADDQPFVRSEVSPDDALEIFADQPYKREIIERVSGVEASDLDVGDQDAGDRISERSRRRVDQLVSQHRLVRRPVPGSACPVDGTTRPFQAAEGCRRVLARQREGSDAAAHLWHGVGVEGGARGPSPPTRGGREARPPQTRRRPRPVELPE